MEQENRYDQRIEIFGDKGRASLDKLPADPDAFFIERYEDAYCFAIKDFLENVVLQGNLPAVSVRDALWAAHLARACDTSAAEGRRVVVEPLDAVIPVYQQHKI